MSDSFSYTTLDELAEAIDRLVTLLSDDEMVDLAGPDAPLREAAAMVREIGRDASELIGVTERHQLLLDTLHDLLANDGALSGSQQVLLGCVREEALRYGQERERLEQKLSEFVRTATAWAELGGSLGVVNGEE
jgi:hypothetical protein